MAPGPNLIDTQRPPYSRTVMSHSNSQSSAALKAASGKSNASVANSNDGIKLVTLGKDTVAIPIPPMASINDPTYLKAASFHNLSDTAYGLLDTYNPPTVTLFVTQELPINTSMALANATSKRDLLITSTSYNNIGIVYDKQGDYDKALIECQKSLKICL